MEIKKILFVLNPKSGKGSNNVKTQIHEFCKENSIEPKLLIIDDDLDLKKELKDLNTQYVVAVGGDGTVNFVASRIINTKVVMGILPAGSANGLANSLGLPGRIKPALEYLLQAHAKPLDVIVINDKYHCLHLCDVGINARVVKQAEKENTKGLSGYALQFFKELMKKNKPVFGMKLIYNTYQKKYKAELLVIANTKQYGTGAEINPTGEFNDGKFEVIIVKPYPWHYIFKLGLAMFTRKTHSLELVKTFTLKKAKIVFKKPQDIQIDGEIVTDITELKVDIIKNAFQVLM